jgi:hypothetical protein
MRKWPIRRPDCGTIKERKCIQQNTVERLTVMQRRAFLATLAASLATIPLRKLRADEKRRPRLLLKNGWQTVNIGDIGHTPGMLRLVAEHLPEIDLVFWPNKIDTDGAEEMIRRHFPKLEIVQGDAAMKNAFETCDFLLHGSGPSLVAAKSVEQWHEQTKKPFGVCGITYSGGAKAILDKAQFVFFRDTISLEHAKKEGVSAPLLEFGPDAAFAVNLRNDEAALAFLKQNGLEEKKFLCVIPRLRNSPYWDIKKNGVKSAEDERKHAENEAMKESDHGKVRPAIIEFVRQTGMKVLLCPEDKSHMGVGKEMFLEKLPDDVKSKVVWREKYWLTDEAVSTYSRALALLSMDMHSPIMALGNGTPAIVCRFKQQTSKGQMWADIGLPEWLFDLDVETGPDHITAALMAIAKDIPGANAKAAKAMDVVHERQKAEMEALKKSLFK